MTARKHLKTRVRARMAHTGERNAAARAHVIPDAQATGSPTTPAQRGVDPAANAMRILLADLGLEVDEPLALTAGGGAGMGVFQFHYAKEEFSSLFLAGRHAWDDDLRFIDGALHGLGLEPIVSETGAPRIADRHLRDALEDGRPAVAWVGLAELDIRATRRSTAAAPITSSSSARSTTRMAWRPSTTSRTSRSRCRSTPSPARGPASRNSATASCACRRTPARRRPIE